MSKEEVDEIKLKPLTAVQLNLSNVVLKEVNGGAGLWLILESIYKT